MGPPTLVRFPDPHYFQVNPTTQPQLSKWPCWGLSRGSVFLTTGVWFNVLHCVSLVLFALKSFSFKRWHRQCFWRLVSLIPESRSSAATSASASLELWWHQHNWQNKTKTQQPSFKTFFFFAVHCKPFHRSQVHFMMAYAWNLTCDHRSNVMINSENDTSFSPRPDLCFYLYLSFGELLFYSVELGPLSIFNQEFVFSRAFVYEHCICIYAHCICI